MKLLKTGRLMALFVALASIAVSGLFNDNSAFGSSAQRSGRKAHTSSKKSKTAKSAKSAKSSRTSKRSVAKKSSRSRSRRDTARRRAEARRRALARRYRAMDAALRKASLAAISKDDVSGEDPQVRKVALDALAGHAGTVVIMDPQTGRVYSIVNQQYGIRSAYKPCSTIKLVVSMAALNEKEVQPQGLVELSGGGREITLQDALAHSNNEYFQEVGDRLGFERLMEYSREFGLGSRTGVNLSGETPGTLPAPSMARGVAHMSSHGDGFAVTALQLATFTSALFNGGYLYKPQVIHSKAEEAAFIPQVHRKLDIADEIRYEVIKGMIGAVQYGTAMTAQDPAGNVAGKTGSCSGQGSRLGLFTSVNNTEHPTLAVSVITRGSSERGRTAAQIAGDVFRALGPRFGESSTRPRFVSSEKSQ